MNISKFIVENVLIEGRLENVKRKYPGYDKQIDLFSSQDPSKNNKYLEWMVKRWLNQENEGNDSLYTHEAVVFLVNEFHEKLGILQRDGKSIDINTYKSLDELDSVLKNTNKRETPSKSKLKNNGDLILDRDDLYVVSPFSYEGARALGCQSNWCIQYAKTRQYWDEYYDDNVFYFIISKKLPKDDPAFAIAVQKNIDSSKNTYWDHEDNSSNFPQNEDIDKTVLDAIESDYPHRLKYRAYSEIKSMLNNPNSRITVKSYIRTSDYMKDSENYKILSLKPSMLLKKEDIFKKATGSLGIDNMVKLLKTLNPDVVHELFHSDIIAKWMDKYVDNDDRLEIIKGVSKFPTKTYSITANWKMSDEERKNYETTSAYMALISNKNDKLEIVDMIELDRLNTQSILQFNNLRQKADANKNFVKLYGLYTDKGLYDEIVANKPFKVLDSVDSERIIDNFINNGQVYDTRTKSFVKK